MSMYFDLTDMRLMLNIAEVKSLTKAAERTFLSLPAASHRIKNLENSIGTELLYRSSQGVTLTPAGEVFVEHAKLVSQQLQYLRGDMKEYAEGIRGRIRVYANTTAMSEFMPAILGRYLALQPDVSIELRERLSIQIVQAITEGHADIGIVAGLDDAVMKSSNLEYLPYRVNKLSFVAHPSHPLAQKGPIDFSETLDESYVCLSEWSAIHGFLLKAASSFGRTLRYRVEVSSFEAVCRMVEAKVGVSVIPETAIDRYAQVMNITKVDLNDAWANRQLQVCIRPNEKLPSFAQPLLDLLLEDVE
ncbi:CysJI operon transcriptional activator [Oligella ureolytica]|uniref:CysJI operon transcriptional activator n=1 Tax=Oligella ureolytica TaxID=90244 RepID=A0A378XF60_9BURK|nr:LysR family transcriptional regulator [Oligella ureolytica]QPT41249.1 LysR family transcriptional regulator [Oligella ureolytica]SUA54249.1 CysJI operon transcriptional activator [Oligella ureolytica]SUA54988.1 CysJI operon transcriptional activator [Oligella ureolytica]